MNSCCPVCSMPPVGGRCPVHGLDVVVIKETTPPPPRAAVAPTVEAADPWVEVEGPVTTLPTTKHEAEVEELRARAAFWKAARLAVLVQAAGDRLNAGEEVITREDLRELAAAVARDETYTIQVRGRLIQTKATLTRLEEELNALRPRLEEKNEQVRQLAAEVQRLRAQLAQEQQ